MQYGARHECAREAYALYKRECSIAAASFASDLPNMLKYKPRAFWQLINAAPSTTTGVTPQQFAEHSRQLLSELGAQEGAQQHATPLDMPAITVEEV